MGKWNKRYIFLEITVAKDYNEREVCYLVQSNLRHSLSANPDVIAGTIKAKQWNRVKAYLKTIRDDYWP